MPEHFSPLAEHEAPSEGEPTQDEQSLKEVQAVKLVERLFTKAKRGRAPYDKNFLDHYKMFRGQQWKEKRPSYRHSEVLNFIFTEVQTIVPILTDSRPNIEALPRDPSDFHFSETMTNILRSRWDARNWSNTVAESIVDASIFGTGIGECQWDEELEEGLGDLTFDTFDPFYFYPDPRSRDVNCKYGNYVIAAEPKDVAEVRKDYPEKRHLIKSDISDLFHARPDRTELDEVKLKSPVDAKTLVEGGRNIDPEMDGQILVLTCWLRDDAETEDELGKDKEGKKQYLRRKKYPRGRKIVIANKVLLEDEENPYEDGKFPFARLIDHVMPREFWGIGEVEHLQKPQEIINKLVSYMLDYLIIMGNPTWVVDSSSGVDTDNLINQPGLVIEKNKGSEVRREPGVNLPPYIFNLFQDFTTRLFDKLSGIHETSRGAQGGVPDLSGIAIDRLQEAAQTKLRLKGRHLEAFLRDIGELMVSRILQYYTVPRVVRITGDDGAARYFKFYVEDRHVKISEKDQIREEMRRFGVMQEYEQVEGEQGGYTEGAVREFDIKGTLDIRVSTGTTLPFAKQQKANQARQLFLDGVIDAEEYLRVIEWPGREKTVVKLKERQNAAAQVQAQAPQAA